MANIYISTINSKSIFEIKLSEIEIQSKKLSIETHAKIILSIPKEIELISMDTGEIVTYDQVGNLINSFLEFDIKPQNNIFKFKQFV